MASSSIPLFGHKYDLTVTTVQGDQILLSSDSWEPEALRITFDVRQTGYQATWDAEICVYNLNSATTQLLITQGAQVELNAGYQVGSNYGLIFSGIVFRVMFEKQDVTDYKLTMQCITGLEQYLNAVVNLATGPFQTQQQIIAAMAAGASTPFQVSHTNDKLAQQRLPCPKVMFGNPKKYIENIARQNNLTWTATANGLYIENFNLATPTADLTYSPLIPIGDTTTVPIPGVTYSIQGTPQQIDQGVVFRVNLDARVQIKLPPMGVKIDNTVIRQQPVQFGSFPPILSQDGIYAVAGIRHIGDSYGASLWTTEIHGVITNAQRAMFAKQGNPDVRNANTNSAGTVNK